ncbi:MAG: hypothetical protein GY820_13320 [Gammaproteobacteria bacterium]|nr:hypothetical protein [Gammaproteobacteria bacterium]
MGGGADPPAYFDYEIARNAKISAIFMETSAIFLTLLCKKWKVHKSGEA